MSLPSDIAIRVTSLSKMFKVYQRPGDMLWEFFTGRPRHKPFWALRDVSFEVQSGQVVGLIGRNGAGKSTLLKILTGTLDKTGGEVEINGRVSSILELGTGFHSEYTGRENIYLGGLLLGLTKKEVEAKIQWIIAFSELEAVIDQTFKTFSTGMQARLTFSTAVCMDPDILVVDEALSVGDAKFQRKCYAKFDEFKKNAKTIVFVSHDINSVNFLCDKAILLEKGSILQEGIPREVTKRYYKILFGQESTVCQQQIKEALNGDAFLQKGKSEELLKYKCLKKSLQEKCNVTNPSDDYDESRCGGRKAEIIDYGILDERGNQATTLETGKHYAIFSRILYHADISDIHLGFGIKNIKGVDLFAVNTFIQKVKVPEGKRGDVVEGIVKTTMWLAPGDYFLYLSAWGLTTEQMYDRRADTLCFKVSGTCNILPESFVNLDAHVFTRYLGNAEFC